jgi:glycine/D-amino acid oxidase-like deaminating enzyme
MATNEEERRELEAKAERFASVGVQSELLDPAQLALREPALRKGLAGGLLVEEGQGVYQIGASRFLLGRALERGGSLRREPVRELVPGGVRTDQGLYHGDAVVLAAGLGITGLLPELPLRPRRGHVVITDRIPGLFRHQLIEMGYLVAAHGRSDAAVAFSCQSRGTGQLLVGGSREFVGLDPNVSREVLTRILRRATWFLPGLAKWPVLRAWVGFRPCGPSNVPVVGPWPGREGLFVAGCHEGIGIMSAMGTAELIAHHVTGIPTVLDPLPFLPNVGEYSHV